MEVLKPDRSLTEMPTPRTGLEATVLLMGLDLQAVDEGRMTGDEFRERWAGIFDGLREIPDAQERDLV